MSAPDTKPTRDLVPRSMDDGPFCWLSHASIIRARSAAGEHGLAVLVALAARAPVNGADFTASIQNICEGASLGRTRVCEVLNALESAKVLARSSGRGRGPARANVASVFRLLKVHLSYAEGGGLVRNADEASSQGGQALVRETRPYYGQVRDISAERQRDDSAPPAPAAPAGAAVAPGPGAEGGWLAPGVL